MEIDLWQLPIPDWGLVCPHCRYALCGLPSHRCPECGGKLDMDEIVRTWTRLREPWFDGTQLPIPDFGFACNGCGLPLAGWKQFVCPVCGAAADVAGRIPAGNWSLVDDPLGGLSPLLAAEHVPHTQAVGSAVRDIYMGSNIVTRRLSVPREFYLDASYILQRAEQKVQAIRALNDTAEWHCKACGESSPIHFEVCWNCQAPRRGGAATT